MFGGKKEKALQDELYTIKKQIAEYSDELKEDSVQMTASRVQMEENIEILEEKLECVGELAEESCRTGKELYSTFVEVHNAVESFEANHSIFIGQVAEQNEKIKEVFEQHKALKEPCAQLEESLYRASKEQDGLGNVTAELEDDAKNMGVLALNAAIEAADIVLMDDDVTKIASVVRIARKTLRIVKQNIVFALAIKALVLILGALGMANMWEAVFADVGVSVIAILNSMRTLNEK